MNFPGKGSEGGRGWMEVWNGREGGGQGGREGGRKGGMDGMKLKREPSRL